MLSAQQYSDYTQSFDSTIFIRDVGVNYSSERELPRYLKSKGSCILTRTVDEYVEKFGIYIAAYAPDKLRRIISWENAQITAKEMKLIPSTFNEFKNNKYYVLPSTIKKYQGFIPNAVPVQNMIFKTEQVYHRSDVTELHTQERWKKHARQVRDKELPVKKVKGLYNDPERVAELFGFW